MSDRFSPRSAKIIDLIGATLNKLPDPPPAGVHAVAAEIRGWCDVLRLVVDEERRQ